MIYLVTVSGEDAGKLGRLVIARKVWSVTDGAFTHTERRILYSETCPIDQLPAVWEHIGEKIVDDAMLEIQMPDRELVSGKKETK